MTNRIDFERKQGYIYLWRQLQDKKYYTDSEFVHLWIHLLIKANHTDKFWNGINIKRGQLLTGRNKLSMETGINESKVERILKYFEKTSQIEQQKTTKYRIIMLLNYDSYQRVDDRVNNNMVNNSFQSEQQKTAECPTMTPLNDDSYQKVNNNMVNNSFQSEQQKTQPIHYNNGKKKIKLINNSVNDKNDKYIKKNTNKVKENNNIPPALEEVVTYCNERENTVDAQKWYDFYTAKGWMIGKNKMKNWKAAVRTWENSQEEAQNGRHKRFSGGCEKESHDKYDGIGTIVND